MAKHKKAPVGLLNTVSSLFLQIITIIGGFIIPRLILGHFGSETNGLVSSLNQFLNYISLLEGGLNGVIMSYLYKPLASRDYKKVSGVVVASTRFFRRISYIFIGYTVILAFIYPVLSHSSFSYSFVASLTMILGIKLFSQYCFSLSYKNLLLASKHGYIINFSQIILIILDVISAIIVVNFFPSIHALKFISALIYILQPIIYGYYVKKHFKLDRSVKPDSGLIASRWDGLSINIAYFIHSNTDVTLLTIFTRLETVSVYGVYALVIAGLRNLVMSIESGIGPSLGNLYAIGDQKELNRKFDLFEYVIFLATFSLFTIGGLLITPFIMIYTHNVIDADYFQPLFGTLFLLGEAIYVLRSPYVRLAYSAGKFKDMRKEAYIEAGINIAISIILVQSLGLVGVAIGTLVAMTYRTLFQIWYLRKHLLNRPFLKFLKRFVAFAVPTLLGIILCLAVYPINEYTIDKLLIGAIIYCAIFAAIYVIVSFVFFRSDLVTFKNYLKHHP